MYKLLTNDTRGTLYRPKKIMCMLKLITSGWLCMMMQVNAADIYAQKVTLDLKNAELKEVLDQIKQQSNYDFMYNSEQLKAIGSFSFKAVNQDLKIVLDRLLTESGFEFIIDNKLVIIKKGKHADRNITEIQLPIKGKVTDEKGKPLEGVTVSVGGKSKYAVATDADGSFLIPKEYIDQEVTFKMVGFKGHRQKLSSEGNNLIRLRIEEGKLDEVVISTGIFKKTDKSFTGASTTVTAKELKQFGTRNLITSLRNIDPSFNIIESNSFGSDPNRMPEIQLRGNSSIPNVDDLKNESRIGLNTPLVILDGFQSTLQKLLDINENDVESITILKDAAATAMYGSRGANGVIVITTKQPAAGKLRISFGSNLNIEAPDLSGYKLLNSRDKLALEQLVGYYNGGNPDLDLSLKKYYNYILGEVNRGVNTNWLSIPLQTSVGHRTNLRLEGGDDALRYSASLQYNNIAGVMKGSGRNTLNGGIALSYKFKNVRFRNSLQITEGKSNSSPYGEFSDYVNLNSYWSPYDENGKVNKFLGNPGNSDYQVYWGNNLPVNPLYNATLNTYDKSNYSEIINNTSVEWDIVEGLQFRTQFGITKNNSQKDRFRPAEHTAFADYSVEDQYRKGDYQYGVGNSLGYDGSMNLGYNKVLNELHNIYLAADFNVRQSKSTNYTFLAEGFTNSRLDFIGSALQYSKGGAPSGTEDITRAVGLSTNLSYNYANRYFTDFLYRRDGSSQFGSNQRFAPFWSFGLGWNLHEENFLKNSSVINRLKLRGSTGIVGSQNFSAYQALTSYKYYNGTNYWAWPGAYLMGMGNSDLKWQQARKNNIGMDLEILGHRLKLRIDVYSETTKDLVSSIDLPASNGFANYVENIGRLRNNGIESQLTYVIMNRPNSFFWSITGSLLQNRNKVIETSQALKDAIANIKSNSTDPGIVYEEGYSSNTIWVVPSMGIDPSNGKEVYRDINGNPTYQWNSSDVVASGSTEAKFFGNFSTMFKYRSFTLNTAFRYTLGSQQYNSTLANRVEATNYKYQMDERVFSSRWKQPGDETFFRGIQITTPTYKTSRFVQKENTLILSNVNLQYDFNDSNWIKKIGLSNLNITGNIAEPMYLSTIHRERGTSYPFSRQFTFGLNATF